MLLTTRTRAHTHTDTHRQREDRHTEREDRHAEREREVERETPGQFRKLQPPAAHIRFKYLDGCVHVCVCVRVYVCVYVWFIQANSQRSVKFVHDAHMMHT